MATVSIQVPMLETKLPVQTVAKARCRNGRKGDTRVGWAGLVTRPGYRDQPRLARARAARRGARSRRGPRPSSVERGAEGVELLGLPAGSEPLGEQLGA